MPYDHDSDGRQVAVSFGRFTLVPSKRALQCDGQPISLGSRAFDILLALLERPGEVVPHRTLIERAWPGLTVEEANLRVHIGHLRRILLQAMGSGNHIINVPGRGYAVTLPVRRAGRSPALTMPEPASTVPAPARRLFGRDADITRLVGLVPERRLVSIVGPAGVGKTALALHLMQALAPQFNSGAHHMDLASASGSDDAFALLHTTLGRPGDAANPLAASGEFLRQRRTLIVIDSGEHVIDAVAALSTWILSVSPQSHILLCSREAARATDESVHVLPSLETAAAVALFMAAARSGGYAREGADCDAADVAAICRQLDGNPLAIEIVASRAGTHGIRGTMALLDNPEWLLNQMRGTAARHRTIAAALGWSSDLLSERDRLVMGRLAVFPGGFTMEAAEAVAVDAEIARCRVEAALSRLLEQSLLTAGQVEGQMVYRFPNLVRIFAWSKFVETAEVAEIRARYARFVRAALTDGGEPTRLSHRQGLIAVR